jgi:hypothetical protein
VSKVVKAALCLLVLAALSPGCGGGDSDEGPSRLDTVGEPPAAAERGPADGSVVVLRSGDRCDPQDYAAATRLPPDLDCDDQTGKIVAAGGGCERGTVVSALASHLTCSGGRWVRIDPAAGAGQVIVPEGGARVPLDLPQEGEPCVPGQPLPPGHVCERPGD